jgi:malate dehydrogenase (oxaloacetate-decarboxylating)(NADP+)
VSEEDPKQGSLYPTLSRIGEVSAHIATAVAEIAYKRGLAMGQAPTDLFGYVQSQMHDPHY